ncbi:acetate--CoA ligase family protein [Anaerotignum sp.]|uniref:acetate--CoA ligase family protein n=1 Tax=Anaerotignum sp. TaxID=2039241 RepID=UPI0037359F62
MSKFLNELEAKELLSAYGIPMASSQLAKTKEEAGKMAKETGFPVVMKVLSADIQHKTDAGCVFIGVKTQEEAESVFETILEHAHTYNPKAVIDGVLIQEMAPAGLEVIVGMKKDPQFGPVILVGSGGIFVEVFQDVSMRLVPLTPQDAKEMLQETKLYQMIQGARGAVYDEVVLVDILLKVSELLRQRPDIEELDINPLFLYEKGKGAKGVDALIRLGDKTK